MLNEALRLIRVFHDLNQKDLADKLGISNSYLSEIESGKKTPTLEVIEKYSQVFNMPSSSILFFSENLNNGGKSEKTRKYISNKVIKILDWISAKSVTQDAI
jgi:transcriptional regulator with XRE-family HTH domain